MGGEDDMGGDMGGEEEEMGGDMGGEEDMAPPGEDDAPPPEEEEDGSGAAAAGAGAAVGAGAVAAGAAASGGGDAPEEAMAPEVVPGDALAPGPAGTRDLDFAEGPMQCSTLRDGLMNASPILQSSLAQIAPVGDDNMLSQVLDDPSLNVTVLLPDEEILQTVGDLLTTNPDSVTPEVVQEILLDHILAEPLEAEELIELGDGPIMLVTGEDIELMIEGSDVVFNLNNVTATVTTPDLDGCAGESVIHRIDGIFADLPTATGGAEGGTRDIGGGDVEAAEEDAASFLFSLAPAVGTALAAVMLML